MDRHRADARSLKERKARIQAAAHRTERKAAETASAEKEALMEKKTLEQIRLYAETGLYKRYPVSRELYADAFTPVEVMRSLRAASRHCYLLESAEDRQRWGRYSFLGYDPSMEITCADGMLTVVQGKEEEEKINHTFPVEHPGKVIREILEEHRTPVMEDLPPFTGGLVGYFSYDYVKYAEPSLKKPIASTGGGQEFRDMDLMLFDKVIVFDNYRQKLILITGVSLTGDLEENCHKAEIELDEMERLIRSQAKAEGSLFDTYRVLRTMNPSPYMFYFSSDDIEIAGASPETLAKMVDGKLFTFPLAGTRPRGRTKEEDLALEAELLKDEKELSEHNMLVDLGRNDIGKISVPGTVRVEKYLEIERFSHVMHIGSTVSGQIRQDRDSVDVVDSILPAGTLSGAPKIRACQIIAELEGQKRGVYGGAIGYLDFAGNVDTCISIRLAYKKNGRVCVQSGAGIVADSIPEKEFNECLNKAGAVLQAVRSAEGGLK